MKFTQLLLRTYFKSASIIAPDRAAQQALRLFQKTRKLPIKPAEQAFFEQVRRFEVPHAPEPVFAYELGNSLGPVVFLVHGWESNGGSMGAIAQHLAGLGYRVIGFDLPAHGRSKLTHTNLFECEDAFLAVINHVAPAEGFSVVSHSFGSAVTTFTLSRKSFSVDQVVFLTAPNHLIDIFTDFKQMIGLGKNAFQRMKQLFKQTFKKNMEDISVENLVRRIRYNHLMIIHDRFDKVIPYQWSLSISQTLPKSTLVPMKKVGHYRMLWNEEVIDRVGEVFEKAGVVSGMME